jgi:small subunit ribosomal protein S13
MINYFNYVIKINKGINKPLLNTFIIDNGFNNKKGVKFLKLKHKIQLNNFLESKSLNKSLNKEIEANISFLIKCKSFKGDRHFLKYPCRGQRTHTNAKTRKSWR